MTREPALSHPAVDPRGVAGVGQIGEGIGCVGQKCAVSREACRPAWHLPTPSLVVYAVKACGRSVLAATIATVPKDIRRSTAGLVRARRPTFRRAGLEPLWRVGAAPLRAPGRSAPVAVDPIWAEGLTHETLADVVVRVTCASEPAVPRAQAREAVRQEVPRAGHPHVVASTQPTAEVVRRCPAKIIERGSATDPHLLAGKRGESQPGISGAQLNCPQPGCAHVVRSCPEDDRAWWRPMGVLSRTIHCGGD